MVVQCSAVIVLKFLTLWEQRVTRGHFALCPCDCAASAVTGLLERTASGKISQVPPRPEEVTDGRLVKGKGACLFERSF